MWLTRTNWNDGDQPTGNDFNNFGRDIRTWGGQVDAANNPLVNLSLMRLNPAALPAVPSAGTFLYDIADSNLKFHNGTAWWVVGGVTAGLGDPGQNGLLKRTALLVTAVAAAGTDYYAPGHTVAAGDLPAAAVVTSGSYSDPSWLTISKTKVGLSAVENTALSTWAGSANITTIGTLVAGSVPWARLTGVPTIPTLVSQLTNDSGFLTAASSLAWAKLTGVPSTFTPAAHATTHAAAGSDPIAISGSQVSGNIAGNAAGFTGNLAGDVSGPQGVTVLATMVGVTPGSYGDASHAPVITVDAKGRITAVSSQAISGGGGGMADPGSNGILKRTALNTTGIAAAGTEYYAPGGAIAAGDLPAAAVVTSGSYSDPSWLTISKTKVGLSAVENTALSTWAGSANITTIGTLAAGSVPWARLTSVPSTFAPTAHAAAHAGAGGDPLTSLGAMSFTGNLTFGTDNSYDIGASGANRPRNLYVAGAGTFGGTITANQFSGSGAGLGAGTIPIAALVAGDYSSKITSGTYNISLSSNAAVADISFVIDGGGSAITTGVKGDLRIDFACTINAWTLLADQSGSAVVNIWKVAYASFPPTSGNKITASAPPTLSSAASTTSSTLTGWTTSIAAGDCLRFNVDSASTCQRLVLCLKVTKS